MNVLPEVRELDDAAVWREGALGRWVKWVIVSACALSIALAAVGARLVWEQDGHHSHVDRFWFCNGVAILLAFWIAVSFVPRWRLTRLLRVATLLPLAHLIAAAIGWQLWLVASPHMKEAMRLSPMLRELPLLPLIEAMAGACAVAGWLIARRRRGEWAHATTTVALAQLLFLGLWLPLASMSLERHVRWTDAGATVHGAPEVIAWVLGPPLAGAIAFAWFSIRRPERLAHHRRTLRTLVIVVFVMAFASRLGEPGNRSVIYANFIHAMIAGAIVAIGSLVALAAANARRVPRRTGQILGVVAADSDGPVVAAYHITSWLRGPRGVARAFVVTTPHGDVPVPAGIPLVAPVPPATTELHTGEAIAVFRAGDRVALEGYEAPSGGQPFRDAQIPVPGSRGIALAAPGAAPGGLAQIALIAWRPCVAYLLILLGIGLPALAGALGA